MKNPQFRSLHHKHNMLPAAAYEVLRALVLGLELREISGEWRFVGPFQEPSRSGVAAAVISTLLENGFICCGNGSQAEITCAGESALRYSTETALQAALTWRGQIGFELD